MAGSSRGGAQGEGAPRVLHLHSTFAAGGKELRSVQLINAFGSKLRHAIVWQRRCCKKN